MTSDLSSLRFAAIHLGPRLHYAVPAVLEEAGMLQALYTDAHAGLPLLRLLQMLPGNLQPRPMRRLLSRRIPAAIAASKIRSWLWPSIQIEWLVRSQPIRRKQARYWHEHRIGGHWLAGRAIGDDFGGANALYVHPCMCTDAVQEAKRRGMFIVVEAISHPFNKLVEMEEYERFGRNSPEPESELRDNIDFFTEEVKAADLVLAASPYVAGGLAEIGFDRDRVAVVPYGLDSSFAAERPSLQVGRVLYVGNIGYLKGVPYFAEAARMLKDANFPGEFRAVGPLEKEMIARPEFQGPHFVGQVPRAEIKSEFLQADVFVFPSLSDGFGIVLLEAMAAGVPVICTPNCAGLVRDGENGFIVPVRDSKMLAKRVSQITQNRELRDRLGAAAKATADVHSLSAYRNGLLRAIQKNCDAQS